MNFERIKMIAAVVLAVAALALLGERLLLRSPDAPISRAQADRIMAELAELRTTVKALSSERGPAEPEGVRTLLVDISGAPTMGREDAPLILVEFSDYQCPFCTRFHKQTWPTLREKYVDSGALRYVVMDLPLNNIHPYARKAAQAAHCAGDQGKYFVMQELLYDNLRRISLETIPEIAREAGADGERFDKCYTGGQYLEKVDQSLAQAVRLGFRGTPTFVLGRITADGQVEGSDIVGAQPLEVFEDAIAKALKEG